MNRFHYFLFTVHRMWNPLDFNSTVAPRNFYLCWLYDFDINLRRLSWDLQMAPELVIGSCTYCKVKR
jgi:hypothetical protein